MHSRRPGRPKASGGDTIARVSQQPVCTGHTVRARGLHDSGLAYGGSKFRLRAPRDPGTRRRPGALERQESVISLPAKAEGSAAQGHAATTKAGQGVEKALCSNKGSMKPMPGYNAPLLS